MKFSKLIVLLAAAVFLLESCDPTSDVKAPKATHLYFSDYNGKRVGVVDLKTPGSFTTLADESDGLDSVSGMAIDFKNGKIYVVEERTNKIKRFNIDGSGSVEVLYDESDGVDMPTSIAVDGSLNDIYWANSGSGQIMRGDVAGLTSIDTLYGGTEYVSYSYGMAIDKQSNSLYFSDLADYGGIWKGDLSEKYSPGRIFVRSVLSTTLQNPSGIFLDASSGRIYWADEGLGVVTQAYIIANAPSPRALFDHEDGITRADGIAVDNGSEKIYWTETDEDTFTIFRGNLDGTESKEVILEGVESYAIVLKFNNQ